MWGSEGSLCDVCLGVMETIKRLWVVKGLLCSMTLYLM